MWPWKRTEIPAENRIVVNNPDSPPGFSYWKNKQSEYLSCSESLLHLLQIDAIENIESETVWSTCSAEFEQEDQEVLKTGKVLTVEKMIPFPNQPPKKFVITRAPWLNPQQKLIGVRVHLTDVTDLRIEKSPAQIQEATSRVRNSIAANIENIIICAPGSIYWKDMNGMYLGCNDFMVNEAGLEKRSDIIGKTDLELWPEQAEKIRKNDLLVMQSGKPISMEETVEGRVFFSLKMALKDEHNEVIGIICNSHDITYLKEIENTLREAKEQSDAANQAKTNFLATVSHELRSPLTSILGMIHFFTTRKDISEAQKISYMQNISISARHLLSLVNDFLDFAKLEAGKFQLILAPLDLKALIIETTTILMPQATEKKLDILVDYDNNIPRLVISDSRAIRQIIINLVGNAIKFTDRGKITIKVQVLEEFDDSIKLRLSVSDTGIGIPENKLGVIFDYFQQVDPSYRRRYGGTGLGLSITKKLVDSMEGTIEVTSEHTKGSTFHVELIFALQDETKLKNPWILHQANVPILIISDTNSGEALCEQVESCNCQLSNSQDALNIFIVSQESSIPYEIVIIDSSIENSTPQKLAQKITEYASLKKPMFLEMSTQTDPPLGETPTSDIFFDRFDRNLPASHLQEKLTSNWENWVNQRNQFQQQTIHYPSLSPQNASSFQNLQIIETDKPKKRVLLVDDEEMVQLIHREFLVDLDCIVDTANNGKQALDMLAKDTHYDYLFADMGMPGISGPDLVRSYRDIERFHNKHMPIIALTSYSSRKDKQNFIDAGVDKVLVKPVTPEQLQATLAEFRESTESQ